MPSYTRQLAEFATSLKLSDVPDDVIGRAKAIILDGLGCGLFGAQLEWTEILSRVVKRLEPHGGQASIWGRGDTASAVNAALVNGTMIQGYELDDANPASIHSCAAVLPAVIAASEYIGADKVTGEKLLTAIIAGFEVGPRVGLCMNGNRMLARGWHTPGIFGPIPAAVAAGIVLGLGSHQLFHALGIAAPQAAGILAAQFGSMVKRMLSAKASQSGLYAALLAAEGFTGIEDVFEAEYGGYCTTFTQSADQFDLSALTDGLGTRWETMRISIKRHASVGTNLAALDAIEELVQETGLKAADVERITFRMTEDAVRHSYWTPYVPAGLTAAQMHLGFCTGMKLIDGEVFIDQMVAGNAGRPDLVDFAKRVDVVRSEERERKGRAFARGADVEVVLKDGSTLEKTVDHFLGSYQRPMTDEQMATKYRRLASRTLSLDNVTELEAIVRNLERASTMTKLVDVLRGTRIGEVMFAQRVIASAVFPVMMLLGAGEVFGQAYPAKVIRIVAPFAPGGGVDSIARMVAHKLTPALGQTVIVDNRPGAGGNIGIRFAAKAAPDGYTLLIMSSNFSINPALYGNAGYDPIKDFDAVAPLTSYMLFLVCHPSLPVRSVKELIALAKSQAGKLTYASGGVGTASHFGGEMFNFATGARITHIPYKGTGPAITETLGGQVSIMFGVPEVVPHVKAGKLVVLAVTGARRSAALPNAPTVSESGVPGFEVSSWHGMFAPAGTPVAIVNRINEEVRKGLTQPDAMEVLKQQGLDLATGTPQELATLVKSTSAKWGKVVKDVGIKVE